MAEVLLQGVTKVYPGGVVAVDQLDLSVADGEFVVLVGPSGCGKSTTLRMIAGLEDLTSGTIHIGGRVVDHLPPRDRDVAMVFQNYALYPHLTVRRNMAFGLMLRRRHAAWGNPLAALVAPARYRAARQERRDIDTRVCAAATLLGITDLLDRRPRALSGGQRQRAAMGRALVRNPQAFLLDEPLSNLDARLRLELRTELKALHRKVPTTTIYVTHDQEEAMTLGDRVVVMQQGRIQQCGRPCDVYASPANRFVAGFIGMPPMNFLDGRLIRNGDALAFDDFDHKLTLCPEQHQILAGHADRPVVMGVRPDAIQIPADGSPAVGPHFATLRAEVSLVEPLGDRVDVHLRTNRHGHLVCRTAGRPDLTTGEVVNLRLDMQRMHFFAPDPTGRNLAHS